MATLKNYQVNPTDGSPGYTVKATSYSFDASTGRHTLKNGRQLVASLVNVNVRQTSEVEADAAEEPGQ